MKIRTYSLAIVKALEENKRGLLLDLSDIPKGYEVILRPIGNKKKERVLYTLKVAR